MQAHRSATQPNRQLQPGTGGRRQVQLQQRLLRLPNSQELSRPDRAREEELPQVQVRIQDRGAHFGLLRPVRHCFRPLGVPHDLRLRTAQLQVQRQLQLQLQRRLRLPQPPHQPTQQHLQVPFIKMIYAKYLLFYLIRNKLSLETYI
jgi:hypothetical protein